MGCRDYCAELLLFFILLVGVGAAGANMYLLYHKSIPQDDGLFVSGISICFVAAFAFFVSIAQLVQHYRRHRQYTIYEANEEVVLSPRS